MSESGSASERVSERVSDTQTEQKNRCRQSAGWCCCSSARITCSFKSSKVFLLVWVVVAMDCRGGGALPLKEKKSIQTQFSNEGKGLLLYMRKKPFITDFDACNSTWQHFGAEAVVAAAAAGSRRRRCCCYS